MTKILASDPSANPAVYTGAAYQLKNPNSLTVDPQGNIWIANSEGPATITQIPARDPNAAIIYDGRQYNWGLIRELVADVQGNIWVLDMENNRVTELFLSPGAC